MQRQLVLAAVTRIQDLHVTYPACPRCHSKLLADPVTHRWHCVRCSKQWNSSQLSWRYRFHVTAADNSGSGDVVLFGSVVENFFGKTATDFHRSLEALEKSGYPAECLLASALSKTFYGQKFYFGFRVLRHSQCEDTGTREHTCLAEIIQSNTSLNQSFSQPSFSQDSESYHAVAYQMIPTTSQPKLTVTDHIRQFVSLLRQGTTLHRETISQHPSATVDDVCQSKEVGQEPRRQQRTSPVNYSRSSQNSLYDTMSQIHAQQDSVVFSFEESYLPNNSPFVDVKTKADSSEQCDTGSPCLHCDKNNQNDPLLTADEQLDFGHKNGCHDNPTAVTCDLDLNSLCHNHAGDETDSGISSFHKGYHKTPPVSVRLAQYQFVLSDSRTVEELEEEQSETFDLQQQKSFCEQITTGSKKILKTKHDDMYSHYQNFTTAENSFTSGSTSGCVVSPQSSKIVCRLENTTFSKPECEEVDSFFLSHIENDFNVMNCYEAVPDSNHIKTALASKVKVKNDTELQGHWTFPSEDHSGIKLLRPHTISQAHCKTTSESNDEYESIVKGIGSHSNNRNRERVQNSCLKSSTGDLSSASLVDKPFCTEEKISNLICADLDVPESEAFDDFLETFCHQLELDDFNCEKNLNVASETAESLSEKCASATDVPHCNSNTVDFCDNVNLKETKNQINTDSYDEELEMFLADSIEGSDKVQDNCDMGEVGKRCMNSNSILHSKDSFIDKQSNEMPRNRKEMSSENSCSTFPEAEKCDSSIVDQTGIDCKPPGHDEAVYDVFNDSFGCMISQLGDNFLMPETCTADRNCLYESHGRFISTTKEFPLEENRLNLNGSPLANTSHHKIRHNSIQHNNVQDKTDSRSLALDSFRSTVSDRENESEMFNPDLKVQLFQSQSLCSNSSVQLFQSQSLCSNSSVQLFQSQSLCSNSSVQLFQSQSLCSDSSVSFVNNTQPFDSDDKSCYTDSQTTDIEQHTPANESHTPDIESHTPDNESHTPDNKSHTTDNESHTMDNESHTSDIESHTPANESHTPDIEHKTRSGCGQTAHKEMSSFLCVEDSIIFSCSSLKQENKLISNSILIDEHSHLTDTCAVTTHFYPGHTEVNGSTDLFDCSTSSMVCDSSDYEAASINLNTIEPAVSGSPDNSSNETCEGEHHNVGGFEEQELYQKKVRFDQRLRRVSSVQLMDIKMRRSETPTVGSCLKVQKSCLKKGQAEVSGFNESKMKETTTTRGWQTGTWADIDIVTGSQDLFDFSPSQRTRSPGPTSNHLKLYFADKENCDASPDLFFSSTPEVDESRLTDVELLSERCTNSVGKNVSSKMNYSNGSKGPGLSTEIRRRRESVLMNVSNLVIDSPNILRSLRGKSYFRASPFKCYLPKTKDHITYIEQVNTDNISCPSTAGSITKLTESCLLKMVEGKIHRELSPLVQGQGQFDSPDLFSPCISMSNCSEGTSVGAGTSPCDTKPSVLCKKLLF